MHNPIGGLRVFSPDYWQNKLVFQCKFWPVTIARGWAVLTQWLGEQSWPPDFWRFPCIIIFMLLIRAASGLYYYFTQKIENIFYIAIPLMTLYQHHIANCASPIATILHVDIPPVFCVAITQSTPSWPALPYRKWLVFNNALTVMNQNPKTLRVFTRANGWCGLVWLGLRFWAKTTFSFI